jgi:hypothetical protein
MSYSAFVTFSAEVRVNALTLMLDASAQDIEFECEGAQTLLDSGHFKNWLFESNCSFLSLIIVVRFCPSLREPLVW